MDKMDPNCGDFEVDLECGMPVIEEDHTIITSPVETVKNQAKSLLAKVGGAFVDKSGGLTEHLLSSSDVVAPMENGKLVTVKGEESVNDREKKVEKERRKKTSSKKAAKPPRPPKGPSLDAADQKLIKEIKEMATLKRARVERLRALKNMKVARQSSSSSSSNIIATMLTLIFFIVILLQGISSRSTSHTSSEGSPVSLHGAEAGSVSFSFFGNPYPSYSNSLVSGSPNLVEQVAGSDPRTRFSRFLR